MKTDFDGGSSRFGLVMGEFDHLPDKTKKKLVNLMSRIMERAYRRGVQQALCMQENDQIEEWILGDTHKYRYGKSLANSIGLDGFTTTSIERLFMEEHLDTIGFKEK